MFKCSCARSHPSSDRVVGTGEPYLTVSQNGAKALKVTFRVYMKCNYCGNIYSFLRDYEAVPESDRDFVSRDILPNYK